MSALVGARDYLLANAPTRYLASTVGKSVVLSANSPVFAVSTAGAGLPAQVQITASLLSIDGPVVFSAPAGTTITTDGHVATLKFIDMGADQVTISASVYDADSNTTYLASQTISKVFDGANGAAGRQTALVYAYIRSAAAPAGNPGAVTFDFTTGKISLPAGDTLASGYSKSIPAGSDPLYVAVASASGTTSTDGIAAAEWAAAVKLAENGLPGAPGINTATVAIYQRSDNVAAPALPTGATTYTFATGILTGLTGGWSQTVPGGTGRYLFISTATAAATGAADAIAASEWAVVRTLAQNGTDGTPGRQTALVYAYIRSATAPVAGPGAVTFDFTTGRIVSPTGNALSNGYNKAIPAGTDPLYVAVASASSITATDDIAADEWGAAVKLAEDGKSGAPGLNAATVAIYQRSDDITPPARPSAVTTYAFGTGVLTGLDGGWSQTVPAGTGRYLFISTATASSTAVTDTIAPGEWAVVRILSQNGQNGQNGQRGTVTISAGGHPTWSDAAAVGEIANAGYGAPIDRDIVTLYSGASVVTKFFQGGQWYVMTMKIDGNLLVTGSVAAGALNVATLSAIAANLGSITAGDLYGTTLHGGVGYPTNVYDWPSNGGSGFHLSAAGLLLGNKKTGSYVEIGASGYVDMPGLKVEGGVANFSGGLVSVTGTFGKITVAPGGSISSGQTGFNTGQGFWLGIDNGVPKFSLGKAGGAGIRWDGNDLFIVNPVVPSIDVTISTGVSGSYFTMGRNAVDTFAGSYTATASNGSGSYSFLWRLEAPRLAEVSAANYTGAQIRPNVSGRGVAGEFDFYAICTCTDNRTGLTKTEYQLFTVNFT